MSNINLTEAINQLKQQVNKETHDLQSKEEELRKRELEVVNLKTEIPRLQKEIENKKQQLIQQGIIVPKLKAEIQRIKFEQGKKHNELQKIQKEYTDALRHSEVKSIKKP